MRDRIQRAALELFYAKGYNATTTRDIAYACGITSGAVYNHFESKDELLLSIIEQSYEVLEREMLRAVLQAGESPVAQLRSLVSAFTEYCVRNRRPALVASQEYKFLAPPELRSVRAARIRLRKMFEEILQRGHQQGVFKLPLVAGEPSPRLAAVAIGDMCIRIAEWFREEGTLSAEEACTRYADMATSIVSK
ncbi:TetR family transcriptional regulator [Steroidobacter agaridevorans]|uniref:TetR family transcriptional regulator n=1 Tax=Steroidobacter agaridevorans TaxID=2695856 RepID=A0A829YGZ3_9GAMM|nr:TetR/AcrR family transcriptional regulator [Steroidobacter agaridevorans]GFE82514.1 TetR family transcriptional regulator [Steroidobacter agaridevorans]